ncbi:hypothetical protein F5B21DRAFT_497059 [Xylaria acuta]|nr:hypothetical protein F5B21DRAFT_497059 [Xylaria acuta]
MATIGRLDSCLGVPQLSAPCQSEAVMVRAWKNQHRGSRAGTICVPARIQTTDQYDIRTSTAMCAVPVRPETGTGLEQHWMGPCTSTTVPVRSLGPYRYGPGLPSTALDEVFPSRIGKGSQPEPRRF